MDKRAYGLEWLLQPTSPATFFNDIWEKQPLPIFRNEETYFRHLLSLADIDRLLASHDLRHPSVQLVQNGAPVPPPQYTTEIDVKGRSISGVVDPVRLYAAYQRGATLTLDNLQRSWEPLARLCASLERVFNHPMQTNVYLTPPRAQGFSPHYDTHDVFILQVAGSKRWRLYNTPVQLPLPDNPYPYPGPDPGRPAAEFELRAGDVLYIPRGHVHDAITSESTSLHITLGINTYTWADLLMEAFHALCQRDVRLRRALPIGFAVDPSAAARLRAEAATLARTLTDNNLPLGEMADGLAERYIRTRPPLLEGHLTGLADVPRLTLESRLCKRAWLYRLTTQGDSVHVLYHGKGLTFPRFLEPTLRFLLDSDVFTVASFPGTLSDRDKLDLAHRLVEEGFLMMAGPIWSS